MSNIITEQGSVFIHYILIIGAIGIPLLITIGYIHYHRTAAFSAEADVIAEAHPYNYKLPPKGWNQQVNYPLYLLLTQFMIKLSNDEKLTEDEHKLENNDKISSFAAFVMSVSEVSDPFENCRKSRIEMDTSKS